MKYPRISKPQFFVILFAFSLLSIGAIQAVDAQGSATTVAVVPSQNTAKIGEDLTINITLSGVENLYGLDVLLSWNASVLQLTNSASLLGVESNSEGVLHEPVLIVLEDALPETGQYRLVATSEDTAGPFSNSGTIATLTFNVLSTGQTNLNLQSELADHPAPDEISEPIAHTTTNGSVNAIIPEFPSTIILIGLLIAVSTTMLLYKGRHTQKP